MGTWDEVSSGDGWSGVILVITGPFCWNQNQSVYVMAQHIGQARLIF